MGSSNKMEKVIDELECAIQYGPHYCGGEFGDENEYSRIGQNVLIDALALLKAQEPRVLALDEIHRGMAVWLEDADKADVILAIGGSSVGGAKCFVTENDMSIAPLSAEYGIRWRAWTAEPTKEQREEAEWGA